MNSSTAFRITNPAAPINPHPRLHHHRIAIPGRHLRTTVVVKSSDRAGSAITNSAEVPVLSPSEVVERLKAFQENRNTKQYLALYSSIFGGITRDPVSMMIPIDDHMVHRGHGVFDTAAIMDGSSIRSILVQTASASKCRQGSLKYWLSAGPGDFSLSSSGCIQSALYVIAIDGEYPPDRKGVKVVTSTIPMKSQYFAVMKNVNYLPNALSKIEAEKNGAFAAIWLDDEGYIAEGPNMNVGFVNADKELLLPHFDKILSGCTAKRVMSLAEKLVNEEMLKGIRFGNISFQEGKEAEEMMLIGSGILVKPVLQWDKDIIGDGKEGPITAALFDLIMEDMRSGPSTVRVPVPY